MSPTRSRACGALAPRSGDSEPPPDDAILEDPPCGYLLTPEQVGTVQAWIDGFDVSTVQVDERTYVPMGQEAQTVIGLMLDGRARSNEVEGSPWPSKPNPAPLRCASDRLGFEGPPAP